MTKKPKALDLFCCGGGASQGLHLAGFEVVGVDINPSPRYPFEFHLADALSFPLSGFDFIWASPPCQVHSATALLRRGRGQETPKHKDLIAGTRARLLAQPAPWIIENVEGSPLLSPILLCGAMFGLRMYRHRLFESNWPIPQPAHAAHLAKTTKMGRPSLPGEFVNPVGNFSGVEEIRRMVGMPWANRYEIAQAVPPVYAEWLGGWAMHQVSLAAGHGHAA